MPIARDQLVRSGTLSIFPDVTKAWSLRGHSLKRAVTH
jgi:hypothetical protein